MIAKCVSDARLPDRAVGEEASAGHFRRYGLGEPCSKLHSADAGCGVKGATHSSTRSIRRHRDLPGACWTGFSRWSFAPCRRAGAFLWAEAAWW